MGTGLQTKIRFLMKSGEELIVVIFVVFGSQTGSITFP
jgi:hypothetical protein